MESKDIPQVTHFAAPSITKWPSAAPVTVTASLSCEPSAEWETAFNVEVGRSPDVLRDASPHLRERQIDFVALPTNIGTLRVQIHRLVKRVGAKAQAND